MTTTSVKDVGSVLSAGIVPGGSANRAGEESFQSVWKSQAGADRADGNQGESYERTVKSEDDVKPGDDLRAKEHSRKEIGREKEESVSDKAKADGLSEDELEKVAEVVGTAAAELIQQIADTFGVSVEEIEGIMADMNLEAMDLQQPENLSNLLLQVSGAESSLALLTNEQLYADYQMLMEQGQAMFEQCSEKLGMDPEELMQAVVQMQDGEEVADALMAATAEDEPVVEIATEKDGKDGLALENGNVAQVQRQSAEDATATAENRQGSHAEDKGNHHSNAEGSGNLVLQTIRDEIAQPQATEMQDTTSTWSTETRDIMNQIMDYMRIQVKPDMSSLEMQLHPASLGTLQIHVASEGGVLTANFVTENETVKAALESQMVQLKESFAEQGVKVEAIEVTVQTHQFEQNLEQGRGRQSGQENATSGVRTRTRRISLGSLDEPEIPEELEAEDRITAEMMAANGQTVDYTA